MRLATATTVALASLLLAACDAGIDVAADELPAQAGLVGGTAPRCPHCGWIESKREIPPGAYEYTVRMADGSTRVFQEALPTTWRVRERLTVIDGTVPRN